MPGQNLGNLGRHRMVVLLVRQQLTLAVEDEAHALGLLLGLELLLDGGSEERGSWTARNSTCSASIPRGASRLSMCLSMFCATSSREAE